jgi:hypothetical protein
MELLLSRGTLEKAGLLRRAWLFSYSLSLVIDNASPAKSHIAKVVVKVYEVIIEVYVVALRYLLYRRAGLVSLATRYSTAQDCLHSSSALDEPISYFHIRLPYPVSWVMTSSPYL